jgi:hypothetical protein
MPTHLKSFLAAVTLLVTLTAFAHAQSFQPVTDEANRDLQSALNLLNDTRSEIASGKIPLIRECSKRLKS